METKEKKRCFICQKEFELNQLVAGEVLNTYITQFIRKEYSNWSTSSCLCFSDLNNIRASFIKKTIEEDLGEMTHLEEEVLQSISDQELLVSNLNKKFEAKLTFGDDLADKVARFGGSWKFILAFSLILVVWVIVNTIVFTQTAFDPYPFIFLNLVLSCLAAIQAPVIMMSQNRQSSKDRMSAELDYKVNLKAELEIRHLKMILDQLANHQWARLLKIQELQTDLMRELVEARATLSQKKTDET